MKEKGFKWIVVSDTAELAVFGNILHVGNCLSLDDLFQKISADIDNDEDAAIEEYRRRHPGVLDEEMPTDMRGMKKAKARSALVQELAALGDGSATYVSVISPKDADTIQASFRSLILPITTKHKTFQEVTRRVCKAPEATWFLVAGAAFIHNGTVDIIRRGQDTWAHLPMSFQMMEPKELDETRTYVCQSKGPTGFTTWISQDVDQIVLVVEEGEGSTVKLVSYTPTNAFCAETAKGEVQRLYEDATIALHDGFIDFQFEASKYDPVREIV